MNTWPEERHELEKDIRALVQKEIRSAVDVIRTTLNIVQTD